ncbi:hypothetical protein J6590_063885 [Homalodisca vitripennis]|nr:hypothetical protein J6590_063885 [Homalodisca vitripennis]
MVKFGGFLAFAQNNYKYPQPDVSKIDYPRHTALTCNPDQKTGLCFKCRKEVYKKQKLSTLSVCDPASLTRIKSHAGKFPSQRAFVVEENQLADGQIVMKRFGQSLPMLSSGILIHLVGSLSPKYPQVMHVKIPATHISMFIVAELEDVKTKKRLRPDEIPQEAVAIAA